MAVHQRKNLDQQVLVITGASSGIGLATARMAAQLGARVVLAAREEEQLLDAVQDIRTAGGQAIHVVADVSDPGDVTRLADRAVAEFGGIDTWVNNAGLSIYGRAEEVPVEDARRLFDVNYWGVVNGSLAALPHLRLTEGTLINVGSIVSDRAVPLQGHYSASKHAVKGFTDALRMELEEQADPVAVTLIKPASIDTPFPEHARNYLEMEPQLPPPVYAPEVVARAILACAEQPRREVIVGGGGRMITALGKLAPGATDRYMQATMFEGQKSDRPAEPDREDSLYAPLGGPSRVRGDYPGHVMKSSAYTQAALHPGALLMGLAALLLLAGARGRGPLERLGRNRRSAVDFDRYGRVDPSGFEPAGYDFGSPYERRFDRYQPAPSPGW
jgi:short-subunit dehydrogenase